MMLAFFLALALGTTNTLLQVNANACHGRSGKNGMGALARGHQQKGLLTNQNPNDTFLNIGT